MAEHAEPVQKKAELAMTRTREADAGSPPQAALLEHRSKAALRPANQALDRRAAAAEASTPRAPKRPAGPQPVQRAQPNRTGLPDRLKAGVEALAGLSMDDVRVYRSSSEPAKLGALAYAQGSDIHLGPGQEEHLPHEAWHVVQQKQGRVRATVNFGTVAINQDPGLEREADALGGRAEEAAPAASPRVAQRVAGSGVMQLFLPGDVHSNYAEAAGKWRNAADEVKRFDREVDALMVGKERAFRESETAQDLNANALAKSVKAKTTGAGEAEEPRYWAAQVQPPIVRGPGGGAGYDIKTYMFAAGSSGSSTRMRGLVEVKTTSSTDSLKSAIADAVASAPDGIGTVSVRHAGDKNDVDALNGATFTRGGVKYVIGPKGDSRATAPVEVECRDGKAGLGVWVAMD